MECNKTFISANVCQLEGSEEGEKQTLRPWSVPSEKGAEDTAAELFLRCVCCLVSMGCMLFDGQRVQSTPQLEELCSFLAYREHDGFVGYRGHGDFCSLGYRGHGGFPSFGGQGDLCFAENTVSPVLLAR